MQYFTVHLSVHVYMIWCLCICGACVLACGTTCGQQFILVTLTLSRRQSSCRYLVLVVGL